MSISISLSFRLEARQLAGKRRLSSSCDAFASHGSCFGWRAGFFGLLIGLLSLRGSAADVIPSLAMADDIIVLIEPGNPAERVTQQFTRLVDAAFRAAAAVMIVPSAITRTKGPIVVIASGPDDPSIFAGLGIAAAANERLIVIPLSNDADSFVALAGRASAVGDRFEVVSVTQRRPTASGLAMSFSHLSERLMVISRGSLDEAFPTEIASLRGIPVLVTEPDVEKVAAPCHYGGPEALTP